MQIIRTNSSHSDFIQLVEKLDAFLKITDQDEHDFYNQFNGIEHIKYVVLAMEGDQAVACGAIKQFNESTMEVKRMFTLASFRGKGIASMILSELEKWSGELGFKRVILETGLRQKEAISLYKKNDFQLIANYGQYKGMDNSRCFEKLLK